MLVQKEICFKFAAVMELAHGVMVTQLFLVQSFKVRVLVGQQKTPHVSEEFFY